MSMTDPIGDMLTRIRNGQRAGKGSILSPASRLRDRYRCAEFFPGSLRQLPRFRRSSRR